MARFSLGFPSWLSAICLVACGSSSAGPPSGASGGSASGASGGTIGVGGGASAGTGTAASGHGGVTAASAGSGTGGASGGNPSVGASGGSSGGNPSGGNPSGGNSSGGNSSGGNSSGGSSSGGNSSAGTAGSGHSAVWRPFNAQSPWNTPIAAGAASDPNSATMIQDFSTIAGQDAFWINIEDYSVPVYFVDSSSAPMVTVQAALAGTGFRTGAAIGDDAGTGMAPIPSGAMAAVGTDRHLAVVDKSANKEWGFWDAANAGGAWTAGEASALDLSGSGVRPPERSDPWWAGHGPRACGFGLIAGLITVDELKAGSIEHALVLAYPHIMSRYYVPPASTAQGTTTDALPTRGIPCGGQIQLDPALNLATLGLSGAGLVVATALQKYGAFVGDYSGAVSLYADASTAAQSYWKTAGLDNATAQQIPLAKFRVLTLGTKYDNMN